MKNQFLTNVFSKVEELLQDDSQTPLFVITPASMSDDLEREILLHLMGNSKRSGNVGYSVSNLRVYAPLEFIISKMEGESSYYSRTPLSPSLQTRLTEEVLAQLSENDLKIYGQVKDKAGFAKQMSDFIVRYFEFKGFALEGKRDAMGDVLRAKVDDIQKLAKLFMAKVEEYQYSTSWGMFSHFKFDALDDFKFLLIRDTKQLTTVESDFYAELAQHAVESAVVTLEPEVNRQLNTTYVQAFDTDLEAKYVVDQIYQLHQQGVKLRDIVVYLPLDESYPYALSSAFNQAEIAYNLPQSFSLASLPLPTLLNALLEEDNRLYSVENMLRMLKTHLITADFKLDTTGEDQDVLDEETEKKVDRKAYIRYLGKILPLIERHLFNTGYQTREKWEEEWKVLDINGYENPSYAQRVNDNINLLRQAALSIIDDFRAGGDLSEVLDQHNVIATHKALTRVNAAKIKLSQAATDGLTGRLTECLNRFYEVLSYQTTNDRRKLRTQFKHVFGQPFTGSHKPLINEVQTAKVTSSLVPKFKYAFIMGMNYDNYPGKLTPAEIFTLKEENQLSELTAGSYPLTGRYFHREFMTSFNQSSQSASEKTFYTFAINDSAGVMHDPSLLFADKPDLMIDTDYDDFAFDEFALELDLLNKRERAGWNKERFTNIPKNLPAKMARMLYLKDEDSYRTSFTAIDEYAQNPYSFFLSRGLRLRKRVIKELSASEKGTYTHTLLENTMNDIGQGMDYKTAIKRALDATESSNHDEKHNEEIIELLNSSSPNKWIHERLNDIFKEYIYNVEQWNKAQNEAGMETIPAGAEFSFSQTDENGDMVRPLSLKLDDDTEIFVTGLIDRFDQVKVGDQTFVNVVDYKTGSSANKVKDLDKKMAKGLQLQLAIYAWALEEFKEDVGKILGSTDYEIGALTYSGVNDRDEKEPLYKGIISEPFADVLNDLGDAQRYGYKREGRSKKFKGKDIEEVIVNAKNQIKRIFTEILAGNIALTPYEDSLKYSDYLDIMNFSEEFDNEYNVLEGGKDNA